MQSLKRAVLPAFLAFSAAVAPFATGCGGCNKSSGSGADARPKVVVSVFPVYDLVRRVAGPDADVVLVLPPGRTAHGFSPSPTDVEAAANAKLAVMVGLGLDPWLETAVKDRAPKARLLKVGDRVPTLAVSDDPLLASLHAKDEDGKRAPEADPDKATLDPHVWLDPERARLVVRAIAEEIGRVDPGHVLGYRERATTLDTSLAALDKEVESRTQALGKRGFMTTHDAFQYFAERYKLDVVAVLEQVPSATPPPERVTKILERAKNAAAIATEPQLDPKPAEALARDAHLPTIVLDPLGGGGPDTDTYEKTIRFDVTQLEKALR